MREKAEAGATLGDITFPLLNMIATMVANVVVEHALNPEDEIEIVRAELDELYTRYLLEYRKQATGQQVH